MGFHQAIESHGSSCGLRQIFGRAIRLHVERLREFGEPPLHFGVADLGAQSRQLFDFDHLDVGAESGGLQRQGLITLAVPGRGADGRTFPWGAEMDISRANTGSKVLWPVDGFPSGASPYGALQMVDRNRV